MSVDPTQCQCDQPGFCHLLNRTMTPVRFNECKNKPGFFKVFLDHARTKTKVEPRPQPALEWNWESGPCKHAGEVTRKVACKPCSGRREADVRHCEIHGECSWTHGVRSEGMSGAVLKSCRHCDDYQPTKVEPKQVAVQLTRPSQFQKTKPITGFLKTGCGRPADGLQDVYRGGAVFLLCGGPSLATMPLDKLNQVGITVAACNNAATLYRPHLWFMVDEPKKFNSALWLDPGVTKFTMDAHNRINGELRSHSKGAIVKTGIFAWQCPNAFFVRVSEFFTAENFLDRPAPAWKCRWHDGKKQHEKSSVMLVAMRMLYWLGFRTVILLGADFHYRPEQTYAFPGCNKSPGACGSNNTTMGVLNHWFGELRPEFERRGFRVYNATPGSRLTAFDFVDFEATVERIAHQSPLETRGLYGGNP